MCFVQKGGHLWELDGRKPWPVRHGPSGAGALLRDAAALARTAFMDVDPAALNFSLVALCAAE